MCSVSASAIQPPQSESIGVPCLQVSCGSKHFGMPSELSHSEQSTLYHLQPVIGKFIFSPLFCSYLIIGKEQLFTYRKIKNICNSGTEIAKL
jgi:hypothetical protein